MNTASPAILSTSFFTKTLEKASVTILRRIQASIDRLKYSGSPKWTFLESRTTYQHSSRSSYFRDAERGSRIHVFLTRRLVSRSFVSCPRLNHPPLFPRETSGSEKSSGLINLSRVSPCFCFWRTLRFSHFLARAIFFNFAPATFLTLSSCSHLKSNFTSNLTRYRFDLETSLVPISFSVPVPDS